MCSCTLVTLERSLSSFWLLLAAILSHGRRLTVLCFKEEKASVYISVIMSQSEKKPVQSLRRLTKEEIMKLCAAMLNQTR